MADKPKKISNFTGDFETQPPEAWARDVNKDLERVSTYLDTFPRLFEAAAQPSIQRNTLAMWHDTGTGKFYLMMNIGGTTKKVELT